MLASIATIFLGFKALDIAYYYYIIYGGWNLILLITFIVLQVKKGTGHGDTNEHEMGSFK